MNNSQSAPRPWARLLSIAFGAGFVTTVFCVPPRSVLAVERYLLPKELVLHAFGVLAALGALFGAARWARISRIDAAVLGFSAISLASALSGLNTSEGLRVAAATCSAAAVFLCVRALEREGRREALMIVTISFGCIAAAVLLEAYGVVEQLSPVGRGPGGTLGNRNHVAHVLVLGLPLLWLFTTTSQRLSLRTWLLTSAALCTAAIALTRSRAAWIALAILLAATLFITLRAPTRPRWAFLMASAVGIVAAMVLPNVLQFRSPPSDSLRRIFEYDSGTGRGRLLQDATLVRMGFAYPALGVGPSNWRAHYSAFAEPGDPNYAEDEVLVPVPSRPQSDWFEVLGERGLPATLLLGGLGVLLLRPVWERLRSRTSGTEIVRDASVFALALFLTQLVVLGALDMVLSLPTGAFLAAVVLGHLSSAREVAGPPEHGRARMVAAIALLAVSGHAIVADVSRIRARQLSGSWHSNELPADRLEIAARTDPGSIEIRVLAARAWVVNRNCAMAEPHLDALEKVFPNLPSAMEMKRQCAGGDSSRARTSR